MGFSAMAESRIVGVLLSLGFCSSGCSFGPSFQGGGDASPSPTTSSTAPMAEPPAEPPAPSNAEVCGNGVVEVGEECDGGRACSVDCRVVACGNGRLEEGEECEPSLDPACSADCRSIFCGNGRVEPGEECEPPNGVACSTQCLTIACGNGRVDSGEECDPPALGSCDSACLSVACGNGSVEEGEGCDPPAPGVCDASCRAEGCGDAVIASSEECDPPVAGACDGRCLKIECGNARLDDGEQCDPPASGSCDPSCRSVWCGDARIDEGEECDPPELGRCTPQCESVVCGDGRLDPGEACEPVGSDDPVCSQTCSIVDATGTEYLYTFDSSTEGWTLYATSPDRLESGTEIRYDSQNGDKTPGALRMNAPFDGSNQKIEVQANFEPIDMRGRTIVARVRLGSGLSSDATNPGGIKLFVKTGDAYNYASGAWTYLRPGEGWVDVTFDCEAPVLVPTEFDASSVRQVGVELRTFTETTSVSPAVVYLDAVSF
jgi:hypothetical protein